MTTQSFNRSSNEFVTVISDIQYATNEPQQFGRQSLDLYLPTDQSLKQATFNSQSTSQSDDQNAYLPPLLVYIHGGLWMDRDKADYANIGHTWAKRGVAVAVVNYRQTSHGEPSADQSINQSTDPAKQPITPAQSVVHPTHTQDLANALYMLISKSSAVAYKYDTNRIMLIGHSCGAHMAGLVALHPFLTSQDPSSYLDLSKRLIGCVGIESLYHMTKWCADFPDWRGDIDKVFVDRERDWLEPVNVPLADCTIETSKASWLLIHSTEDAWVNVGQHESMIQHVVSLGLDASLHSIQGGHFGVVDNIGTTEDVITDKVFEFLLAHC